MRRGVVLFEGRGREAEERRGARGGRPECVAHGGVGTAERWFDETTMASIARRDDGHWRARYRDPAGREHARHFTRKVDAQRWLDDVVTAVNTGAWVDPLRAQVTVGEWAQQWLEGQSHLKPSSWERYAGILREHVLPEWGEHRIADVGHGEIQRWVATLMAESSPSTVHEIHRTLSLVLKLAVKDGRLFRNPADGVNLPRIVAVEHVYSPTTRSTSWPSAAGRTG